MTDVRTPARAALAILVLVTGDALVRSAPTSDASGPGGAAARTSPSVVQPRGAPGRWRLVFRDEFRGDRLDLDTWRPNWLGGSDRAITKPVNDAELAAYDPRQVRVRGGSLRLRAVERETVDDHGRRYRYASGLVESFHDYRFRYGFAEARIHLPANTERSLGAVGGCGPNWPAFWLSGEDHPEDGEIDVMECLGDDVAWHYHWAKGSAGGYPKRWRGTMPGGGGWHTFGVDWRRNRPTFYYDGRKVGTQRRGVTGAPHYLILNNGISGRRIKVPATLRVDYVRVWRRTSGRA